MADLSKLKIPDGKAKTRDGSDTGKLAAALLCGAVLGFLLAFFLLPQDTEKSDNPVQAAQTPKPAQDDRPRAFTAGGWIEVATPQYPMVVSSRVEQRLDKLLVRQGDAVSSGQELALLYSEGYKDKVLKSEALLKAIQEDLRFAKAKHERNAKLGQGIVSAEELERDAAAYAAASAREAAAKAELALAKKDLSYCSLKAPQSENQLVVLDVLHSPGDWISYNNAAVIALYDPTDMQVRVDVPQSKIRMVSLGQTVSVRTEAHPSHKYSGTVIRIDPLAELAKNTISVRIRISEPDRRLFPEMVAHVSFLVDK